MLRIRISEKIQSPKAHRHFSVRRHAVVPRSVAARNPADSPEGESASVPRSLGKLPLRSSLAATCNHDNKKDESLPFGKSLRLLQFFDLIFAHKTPQHIFCSWSYTRPINAKPIPSSASQNKRFHVRRKIHAQNVIRQRKAP